MFPKRDSKEPARIWSYIGQINLKIYDKRVHRKSGMRKTCSYERRIPRKHDSLWTWQRPIANCDNSGIWRRISSVTRWTPLCWGLRFIFFWNHAELHWIILADEAMFDLLSLLVASLTVFPIYLQHSRNTITSKHHGNVLSTR